MPTSFDRGIEFLLLEELDAFDVKTALEQNLKANQTYDCRNPCRPSLHTLLLRKTSMKSSCATERQTVLAPWRQAFQQLRLRFLN